jgi:hypothetical protein
MDAVFLVALLACPVGMGLMMWFMGKNMKGGEKSSGDGEWSAERGPRSVMELRTEQSRLSDEIEWLEHGEGSRDGELAKR